MAIQNSVASFLMALVLAAGFSGKAPEANAASLPVLKAEDGARSNVVEIKQRRRGQRLYVPIAPNYLAYDYPYYYSRGYYPRRIGRGYVYYGYPYSYYRGVYSAKAGSRCSVWHRRCVARAGRRQQEACRCR